MKSNRILKYSGLVFQIFISLGLAAWAGTWLDKKWNLDSPIMTIVCCCSMLVAIFVWLYYDLQKID